MQKKTIRSPKLSILWPFEQNSSQDNTEIWAKVSLDMIVVGSGFLLLTLK